ncbi:MAG: Hpt domain-containing protein [Acidobacteriota bacterium]
MPGATKSASGSIGACELQEIASRLEDAGAKGDLNESSSLIPMLKAEFDQFRALLGSGQ